MQKFKYLRQIYVFIFEIGFIADHFLLAATAAGLKTAVMEGLSGWALELWNRILKRIISRMIFIRFSDFIRFLTCRKPLLLWSF